MLAPKFHFFVKKKLLEISQKKEPPKSQTSSGGRNGEAGWLPESPPSRTRFFKQETIVWAIVGHGSGLVAKKNGVGAKKRKKVNQNLLKKVFELLEQMLLL